MLKSVYLKRENESFFLKNLSGEPEIVLIFPITRDNSSSLEKWRIVLEFVEKSNVGTLLVIDKTESGSATDFFMRHFDSPKVQLVVFPRNIKDTLFDSVGEIVLDANMWIIQVHDDDNWFGELELPEITNPGVIYFFDFYIASETSGSSSIQDFSIPNRIVFSLVPSHLWNRFSKLIQDQKYHVAGSFDFTLNLMAQLTCQFDYQSGFEYHWKDDNWNTPKNSVNHLTNLAKSDGWKEWSSPEIANLNRAIDSLSSLNYIKDLIGREVILQELSRILTSFQPSRKRRIKFKLVFPLLNLAIVFRPLFYRSKGREERRTVILQEQLSLYRFIAKSWKIQSLDDVIDTINSLESMKDFEALQTRFLFWKKALTELSEGY